MKILKVIRQSVLSLLMLVAVGAVMAQSKIYYVSPNGSGTKDGLSWANTMSLESALTAAKAGDQIWVQGFEQIDATDKLYITPTTDGFTLKSGVQLYGGFKGDEKSINERETLGKAYQMKYRSVLSGDIKKDDKVDPNKFIFPENTLRQDNANHVLILNAFRDNANNTNSNSTRTVVDGLTIAGGHSSDFGGGIYVNGVADNSVPYSIERCYLLNNYAPKGGAIYVDDKVKNVNNNTSFINQCVVYNNVAGTIIGKENVGGGIYLAGAGNIVNSSIFNNENGGVVLSADAYLVNSTVARNTGGGVDMAMSPVPETAHVFNSVVWGNSFVWAANAPIFQNSAYPNAAGNNNINLSTNNRGDETSPMFDAPSLKTSFDTDYDWRRNAYPLWSWKLMEGSGLIDQGNNEIYNTYAGAIGTDLSGATRIVGDIDINAYEFQAVPPSRIRYVKTNGSDNNDGLSWETAYKSVQKAINVLAEQPGIPGEVWVAAGTYQPTERLDGPTSPASFRMYNGISVFGGFAGTEGSKDERAKYTMPWQFTNKTIFQGSTFNGENVWNITDNKWSLNSASTHVVWFAPLSDSEQFNTITVLDGVTIEGGQAKESDALNYMGDRGAGVYMSGDYAYLNNCVVRNNIAPSQGGGIYQKGGRITGCLVYNNSSETKGGGIYVDNAGLVLRTMVSNNSALEGGGVYLDNYTSQADGKMHPEYQILSTSIVTNNTSVRNGAVYCNKGGIIMQTTIANNDCPTATDAASGSASQTGGLYIDSYAKVINSVLWNNLIKERKVQLYAANPSAQNVGFYYSAVANMNNIIWNNTLQQELIALSESNRVQDETVLDPGFEPGNLPATVGVQGNVEDIEYFWQPITGSNLRARGMSLGMLPDEVLVAPELDIEGKLFAQKPAVGAYHVEQTTIVPEETSDYIRIYVDVECTKPEHNGSLWATAYRSLNEAISYMASLTAAEVGSKDLQIYVMQGDAWPRYASVNLDPKSATIDVPAMASGNKLIIKGGYSRENHGTWAPLTYRSQINGNHEGKKIEDGLYHCITVQKDAKVEFDGFHIINGYAAGTANLKYGAGMLVRDGANVTVKNSIFENNTAAEGAAIDARGATLTLVNCVVNNNTNTDNTKNIINAKSLTMNHVTVVNNVGAAPAKMGTSSFAAGNISGNTFNYASVGAEGNKNFTNPTNKQGATLGFDTYLGGYSNFSPLTSSTDAGNLINKASGTPTDILTDIAGNARSLGGAPDLGAYEASLPKAGDVIYVTATGAGKMDGSSWENAIAGNLIYDVNAGKRVDGNISTTDSRYIGFYDASARPYGETSGASKLFFEHMGEARVINGTAVDNVEYKVETLAVGQWDDRKETHISGASRIDIKNNRKEQYVGGLQYAVEVAAVNASKDGKQRTVWVAGGTYTDYKGFVIRDKVDVFGGFPNEGTPGEDDRHPLVSQYIPANTADAGLEKTKYETIIQIQAVKPWTYNSSNNPGANPDAKLPKQTRKPVLFQPDVCLPTKSPSGRESSYTYYKKRDRLIGNSHWNGQEYGNSVPGADENASNTYRWKSGDNGYVEYTGAIWDGFTIRHGFYTDYKANRDGGAGVRMFRGVTLQNCVVTDNYINAHNNAGRGAGIYCDGNNSKVVNCFVLNNVNNSDESYGGGMYMILGTSYNTMIANNYAKSNGGGIFIEDAMFYNNTVTYNSSGGTGGLHQWTASSGTNTTLKLYNTIFYGNTGKAIGVSSVGNFNGAWNCYVQTASTLESNVQSKIYDSQIGTDLALPFESANAQTENNYRLNGTTWCLNNGAENLGNDYQGKPVVLPYTDVDFTDRIKNCTVDIGAYERSNEENVKPDENGVYYVTQNGAGTSDGSSVANASCAMELQRVLNAAGERVKIGQTAIVKIAGYEGANAFVYHANTLSDPNDPQSYTYVIPYGVTVMGGYDGLSNDWSDDKRNPKNYRTVLSAINNIATLEQEVNGYHTVTFGEPTDVQSGKTTIIDGLYLIDGKATSQAGEGNPNTRGGGAIVPAWAHVRNCVVAQCEAVQGGGLYLLPGATVSGTLVMENKAEDGGGIYAEAEGATKDLRAHIISCTISDNTATAEGGGFYLEDGAALTTNSVIWGNTAASDKNISGAASLTFEDTKFENVVGEGVISDFYPFNHCYVETYEMPSNYENTAMESDEDLYFAADRTLRAYSELIKHGTPNYDGLLRVFGIAEKDMQGIDRKQDGADRIDVGAYAYNGGMIPLPTTSSDPVVKKIFVSKSNNIATEEEMDKVIGRSFFTSLSWLDDALDYIKNVRNVSGLENTEFEVYLAGGTYKPSNRRTDAATTEIDQRQNSYVIPEGVKIYGGFSGEEEYGYGIISLTSTEGETIELVDVTEGSSGLLADRSYSDLNNNGIFEPWELANQSILSGDINVSPTVKNAYHVVYSSVGSNSGLIGKGVLFDGLTIKDGETLNELSSPENKDEIGRGGAIYTKGVNYILNGCRVMNSRAVRGGAIYSRDADMTIIGSVIGGNGTIEASLEGYDLRGGAIYMSAHEKDISLKAVNTLWANNETTGKGGAIATSNDLNYNSKKVTISLMNNTIVRNKAAEASAVYSTSNGTITNTVMWGGEGTGVVSTGLTVNNSASETELTGNNNIKLNASNMAIDGPRFAQPSTQAGMTGNDVASKWNPASVSLLTDAGDGELGYYVDDVTQASGAYKVWWTNNGLTAYQTLYMKSDNYLRYKGQRPLFGEKPNPKKIDIGLYEYQYKSNFLTMDEIYVDTQERGDGSGDSWSNATSDLRGAIVALSAPEGGNTTDKAIYIRGGEYPQSQLYVDDIAYQAILDGATDSNISSLTIKGSYAENGLQDFSQPTVFLPSSGKQVNTMFYTKTNGKTLTIEGITFREATAAGFDADNSGKLTLKNVAFRKNYIGAKIKNTDSGSAIIANTLFANGETGLTTTGNNVTVVNATFANNTTAAVSGAATIYNTVSWNSGEDIKDNKENCNVNLGDVANEDILNGPNFVDPANGNYMIRPSIKLLNTGNTINYNDLLGSNAADNDKDLASNARLTGDQLDIGAYEYNAPLQEIIYVKTNVATTDGSGKSWENPIKDLQGAIDLAAIYANKNEGKNGYVFVHRDVQNGTDIRVNMPGVKVYGGMNDEVGTDAQTVLNARGSVLASQMSTINGLTIAGEGSVVDGFKVNGTVTVGNGVLATSVVEKTDVSGEADGLLYNSLVLGSVRDIKAVNVTATDTIAEVTGNGNNRAYATTNSYVTEGYWKYQLMETADGDIDKGNNETTQSCIDKVGHNRDLASNLRIRNIVDNGCFETWNISEEMTTGNIITTTDYPIGNSVVYVRKGQELKIKNADDGTLVYKDATSAFNPGFLLLEHQAGLRGNGNHIRLTNFAVERSLSAKGNDMAIMPFNIIDYSPVEGYNLKRYSGEKRAAYNYRYDGENSTAWISENFTQIGTTEGFLIENTLDNEITVRFRGNSYSESGEEKIVNLTKWNYSEPWDSNTESSNKFTHKENMSWNLFGSPYLCAMNYSDMEYGRVIYGLNGNSYETINTANETSGYIPAGDAVFTQTATLKDYETFSVTQSSEKSGTAYAASANLKVQLQSMRPTKSGEESPGDEILLDTTSPENSSTTFDLASDGVKWMSMNEDVPQIYMQRSGGRYSLLSAVNEEGEVEVGVRVGSAGTYLISLADGLDLSSYQSVLLTDLHAGKMVDLMKENYPFEATRGGDMEGRFRLSFNRNISEVELNVRLYSPSSGTVVVEGLPENSRVHWFQPDGRRVEVRDAFNWKETFYMQPGIYMMEVYDMGEKNRIGSYKIRVK